MGDNIAESLLEVKSDFIVDSQLSEIVIIVEQKMYLIVKNVVFEVFSKIHQSGLF